MNTIFRSICLQKKIMKTLLDKLKGWLLLYNPLFAQINEIVEMPEGSFTEVQLAIGEIVKAPAMPESAVLEDYGSYSVIVQLSGESFERRPVIIGRNRFSFISGGMPGPLSMISILRTLRCRTEAIVNWRSVRVTILIEGCEVRSRLCIAFRTMLSTAWKIKSGSMRISGIDGS